MGYTHSMPDDLRDITVIGAGPAGMFAVFEAGMHELSCHLVDALPQLGGQMAALYPEKPIYDIPGFAEVTARAFIGRLEEQMRPVAPRMHLQSMVTAIEGGPGEFHCRTSQEQLLRSRAVILACGKGAFTPRRPKVEGIEAYEIKSVLYMPGDPAELAGKRVVIQGGGDSALDWAVQLVRSGARVCLVHRRGRFRAHPRTVAEFQSLVEAEAAEMIVPGQVVGIEGDAGNGTLHALHIDTPEGEVVREADLWLPMLGVMGDTRTMEGWGITLRGGRVEVDAASMQSDRSGVYAIGDLCAYPGKYDLILAGFAEAAMAIKHAFDICRPQERYSHAYSTQKGAPHAVG
jgi:thioredoxin reductase (NADPH)